MVIAIRPDSPTPIVLTQPDQLEEVLIRHPTLRLYGEFEGVVFSGDQIDSAALANLRFWWAARPQEGLRHS